MSSDQIETITLDTIKQDSELAKIFRLSKSEDIDSVMVVLKIESSKQMVLRFSIYSRSFYGGSKMLQVLLPFLLEGDARSATGRVELHQRINLYVNPNMTFRFTIDKSAGGEPNMFDVHDCKQDITMTVKSSDLQATLMTIKELFPAEKVFHAGQESVHIKDPYQARLHTGDINASVVRSTPEPYLGGIYEIGDKRFFIALQYTSIKARIDEHKLIQECLRDNGAVFSPIAGADYFLVVVSYSAQRLTDVLELVDGENIEWDYNYALEFLNRSAAIL